MSHISFQTRKYKSFWPAPTVGPTNIPVSYTHLDVYKRQLAVVRVLEEGWGNRIDFTDVLLLLKMNGEWKCVAKAYNQNSNTIQKK